MSATSPNPRTSSARDRGGVFRGRGFRWFFTSRALADTGTEMGAIAVSLLAITLLHASPGQVGLLGVLSTAAFLLIGLPAGVRVDRTRRRSILVVGNLCHGVVLLSIPVAWALGWLTLWQLYACVLLGGATTVFTRVAQQSYLPFLVEREEPRRVRFRTGPGACLPRQYLVRVARHDDVCGRPFICLTESALIFGGERQRGVRRLTKGARFRQAASRRPRLPVSSSETCRLMPTCVS